MPLIPSAGVEPTFATKFFSAGVAACIGDAVTFPLDTAKVRLQVQGENGTQKNVGGKMTKQVFKYRGLYGTMRVIIREEGVRGLYSGIVPGLQRQMCFASLRIGFYDDVKKMYLNVFQKDSKNQQMTLGIRILSGLTTGGLSVCLVQPTDVVKIRMQAQMCNGGAKLYTGALQAYKKIALEEGLRGLWKGCPPNVLRNAIVNAAELATYDVIKEELIALGILNDNLPCHFVSGFGAGFCATLVASPVDVVKTRYMNSPKGKYSGALQVAVLTFKEGGFKAFYKGFIPSFMRIGSWNVTMFICFEQLKRTFTPKPTPTPVMMVQ